MPKEDEQWQLVKRLDAIINILLETATIDSKPLTELKKIDILDAAGLRPIEISKILGKPLSHVTSQQTRIRRARGR